MIFLFLLLNLAIATQLINPMIYQSHHSPTRGCQISFDFVRLPWKDWRALGYSLWYRRFDLRNVLPSVIATNDYSCG